MKPKTHIATASADAAFCGRYNLGDELLEFDAPAEATCKTCQRCYALTQEVENVDR